MPKKESIKRGYMTLEEIEEHLKKFETPEEKVKYLSKSLLVGRGRFLSDKTKTAIQAISWEQQGDYDAKLEQYDKKYEAKHRTDAGVDYEQAGLKYEKIGELKRALNCYEKAEKFGHTPKGVKEIRKKLSENSLEGKLPVVIGIGGLTLAIFFLSSNLTGNVIGNLTQTNSTWIGGILFIIGLVGSYFYFKKK